MERALTKIDKKKSAYSIGEVASLLELETYVLRYWETQFDILAPKKDKTGNRSYSEYDIAVAKYIQYLLKEVKFTIEGARQVIDAKSNLDSQIPFYEILLELRAFLKQVAFSKESKES